MSKIYSLDRIKRVLKSVRAIPEIEEGFAAYSQGKAVIPPVGELLFDAPPGDTHIKYGYLRDDDTCVIKIAKAVYQGLRRIDEREQP